MFVLCMLVFFRVADASFEITEIMYNPSREDAGHEWVEVKNSGPVTEDLSKWYLFTDGVKHALTPVGAPTILQDSYVIIAQDPIKFKIDYPNFTGLLFDSSWTDFNNKSEIIGIKDPQSNLVDQVQVTSAMGSNCDGDSLQKIGGIFVSSKPTPGSENMKSTPIIKSEPSVTTETPVQPSHKNKHSVVSKDQGGVVDLNSLPKDSLGENTGRPKESQNHSKSLPVSIYPYLGLLGVVILGSSATIALYRKRDTEEESDHLDADDIEIID